ncbi:unnamed protein product [Ilex paraguariensis]|uniref:Uncharacterized protein n=1 Tax=Ilex paraguariensis TaxID=185542 RepID=A0ABC8TN32_9AQUA
MDTFRMLQCLEWEPSGSFYQAHPVESRVNGPFTDHSVTSGLIDINLAAEMTDPTLPPNPRKAVLYRPSVTQLIAVIATICEELPLDSVMLIYLSASGKVGHSSASQMETCGTSKKSSRSNVSSYTLREQNGLHKNQVNDQEDSSHCFENYLWLGPSRNGDLNNLYPGDIIPFTRRPLFLIIDSDKSHVFKVLHGAERGEATAILLSPLRSSFKNPRGSDATQNGSQFTLFLTSPLGAFCQLVGLTSSADETGIYSDAARVISAAFSEWEVILCTSTSLDLVWAQVLSDPLLRRLILRFIFCRSVLTLFCPWEESEQYLPVCLPELPRSVSPNSKAVQSAILQLVKHLNKQLHWLHGTKSRRRLTAGISVDLKKVKSWSFTNYHVRPTIQGLFSVLVGWLLMLGLFVHEGFIGELCIELTWLIVLFVIVATELFIICSYLCIMAAAG